MPRGIALTLPLVVASALQTFAWSPAAQASFGVATNSFLWRTSRQMTSFRAGVPALHMALDYNDPVVAEEFAAVQPMTFEEVEEELLRSGVTASSTMNEMDVKLMLVELRMRLSGKMPGSAPKKTKPAKFSSKFEEALWEKPMFKEFYDNLKQKGDHNAMNVAAEYVNDPKLAETRYGNDYRTTIKGVQASLTAKPPVKSPTVTFSGFPANMGEMGCKMTLESVGSVLEFECTEDEDFPILKGKVTFEDIDMAKKAIEQYDGMDMGMGSSLELTSV